MQYIGGAGMLNAAHRWQEVVFTSTQQRHRFCCHQSGAGKSGALMVVKNYTGDRMKLGIGRRRMMEKGRAVRLVERSSWMTMLCLRTRSHGR